MAQRPNVGAKNWNFLKLPKTMIVGALWFRLGLLSISILLFLKSDGKCVLCVKRPQFAYNFAKFQYFLMGPVLIFSKIF